MNSTVMKTRTEQFLADELAAKGRSLPGPAVARADAMARFSKAGFPHRRIEAWKYSDLRNVLKDAAPIASAAPGIALDQAAVDRALGPLATLDAQRVVFVDGYLSHDLSELSGPFEVSGIAGVLDQEDLGRSALPSEESIVDLNRALVSDGVQVSVGGATVTKPLMIVNIATGYSEGFVSIRHRVSFAASVRATLVEVHCTLTPEAGGQQNVVVDIALGQGSEVQHIVVGLEGHRRTSLVTTGCAIGDNANYRGFQFSASTAFARRQSFIRFDGEGGKLDFSGLLLGHGSEHCDTTLVIDHAVPGCESREHFKAVLDDAARAVFQAKVIVRQDAQKTDGKQMANALMLSPAAEFDSKPELEIYADDVVCGHGATVAEIDEDVLFYLRTRGIPKSDARAMLIESFAVDVLDKVENEDIRAALRSMTIAWLASNGGRDQS